MKASRKKCFYVDAKTENVCPVFIFMTGAVVHESKAGFPTLREWALEKKLSHGSFDTNKSVN